MNYRHVYHAGNFADVFKHIIVTRIVDYLKRKPAAFRVIDTHSGIGLYDLRSVEAQKTGEWHQGVAKFLTGKFDVREQQLLTPWIDAIQSFNEQTISGDVLKFYPGSPLIIRHSLRKQDRFAGIELHQQDYQTLAEHFVGDYQSRITHLDGWLALKAHVPPKERRGMILIDPPFEETGEFERLVTGLAAAYRRFSTGIFALWYPVKHKTQVDNFIRQLREAPLKRALRLELQIRPFSHPPTMVGCGMIIVNPPYILADEIKVLTPLFVNRLGTDGEAKLTTEWIHREDL